LDFKPTEVQWDPEVKLLFEQVEWNQSILQLLLFYPSKIRIKSSLT
jgi:hypothetical protein